MIDFATSAHWFWSGTVGLESWKATCADVVGADVFERHVDEHLAELVQSALPNVELTALGVDVLSPTSG